MERKEIKIQAPEGHEIDRENSIFECIKFKPIKRHITYKDICKKIFKKVYYIRPLGEIGELAEPYDFLLNKNNATNSRQLEKLLALNQLLNIAEYYNKLHTTNIKNTTIDYDGVNQRYYTSGISTMYLRGVSAVFNSKEDAQEVIDNPNFREILDMVYKN